MTKTDSPNRFFIPFHPWLYFSIFLVANSLLSYFHLPLWLHWGALGGGLLLPFMAAWITYRPAGKPVESLFQAEFLPPISGWVLVFLGLSALFIRFYRLTSLAYWPRFDEGVTDYYALHVMEKGIDRFFFTNSQVPP